MLSIIDRFLTRIILFFFSASFYFPFIRNLSSQTRIVMSHIYCHYHHRSFRFYVDRLIVRLFYRHRVDRFDFISLFIFLFFSFIFFVATPFGQMPILEFDGKVYSQTLPICRYLARKYNLNGKTDLDDLQIDAIANALHDLRKRKNV